MLEKTRNGENMDVGEITRIRDQFQGGQWPQFLERIDIAGLRGWQGQVIQFKFPVVAIVGENGAGKSTVLKVAAAAYDKTKDGGYYPPTSFWIRTGTHFPQSTSDIRLKPVM